MGSRRNFQLTYDGLLVTMAGLPAHLQSEVFKNFRWFDVPLQTFLEFLTVLSTADNIRATKAKVQAVTQKKKDDKPTARCAKCKSKWHTTDKCKKCMYCSRWGHSTHRCWEDPSNNCTRQRPPPTVNAVEPTQAQAMLWQGWGWIGQLPGSGHSLTTATPSPSCQILDLA